MTENAPAEALYEVIDAALALSRDQRIALLYAVETSLLPDLDESVLEESRRIAEDMRSGRVRAVPAEEFVEELDRIAAS